MEFGGAERKDAVAAYLFGSTLLASVLSERLCGPDGADCPVDWPQLYGRDATYNPGHCAVPMGAGLGPRCFRSRRLCCVWR